MAVRTKEEILEAVRARLDDDTSDEAIALVEDITDTLRDYETRAGVDWEKKYMDNDVAWRQRYRDRFFGTGAADDETGQRPDGPLPDDPPEEDKRPKTFEELFSIE